MRSHYIFPVQNSTRNLWNMPCGNMHTMCVTNVKRYIHSLTDCIPVYCVQAYYGGEAHCAEAVGASDDYDPTELVCPSCSNTGGQLQVNKYM